MKAGIIGLGNIAQKAYLPILSSRDDLNLALFTQDKEKLNYLSNKHNIKETVKNIDELIKQKIELAFVHASTSAHYNIVKKLLKNKIHVYVDKPLSTNIEKTRYIYKLAEQNNLYLKVGFNRRYVPFYSEVKTTSGSKLVIMQKNRANNPRSVRQVIYDDYIHIIDTINWMIGGTLETKVVDYKLKNKKLSKIIVTFKNNTNTGIGIMNRNNGLAEEKIEVLGENSKKKVDNLKSLKIYKNNKKEIQKSKSWEPMLKTKGFAPIVDEFINSVKHNEYDVEMRELDLQTHEICEKIIRKIS